MSDGNFNRALLPTTPYASGLKAGKSMMKMKATEVFKQWLLDNRPEMTATDIQAAVEDFRRKLVI